MHIINRRKLTFTPEAKSYISHFVARGNKDVNLTMTSLIDIFTILLIFLLKSYTASGFTMPLTPGIKLPVANFTANPYPAAIVSVTNDYITLDSVKVLSVDDIRSNKTDLRIEKLENALSTVKKNIINTGKLNSSIKFTGHVIIEGDREIPFDLLQKIMYTSGKVGFDKISLAVIRKDEKG